MSPVKKTALFYIPHPTMFLQFHSDSSFLLVVVEAQTSSCERVPDKSPVYSRVIPAASPPHSEETSRFSTFERSSFKMHVSSSSATRCQVY